MQSGQRER